MEDEKVLLRYRGREIAEADAAFIRALIARHPEASRRQLSALLCQAWDWRQPNGALSDLLCRGLLLALDRAGHVALPAVRQRPPNNIVRRRTPDLVAIDTAPLIAPLAELTPLEILQVRRGPHEALFDSLIHHHHYLGYTRPVGEHLEFLVRSRTGRPVAALSFSSAPRHLGPRDRYLGWSPETRRRNLRFLVYHPRFLVLPWVRVPHLASHVLSRTLRRLSDEWERAYGHPVYFVETFVDPTRFHGTCYRAANWLYLGRTTGRGKDDQTHKPNRSLKDVLGYPLCRSFRERLCQRT